MRLTPIALAVFALSAGLASAADNPIAARKALMDSNAAAAKMSGAMLKEDLPYTPTAGLAAIAALHATAVSYGAFFPDNSKTGGGTHASPKIWTDRAGFDKALGKFKSDTEAAMEVAGEDGPADLAAFKAAVGPVLGNCKSCHESYRVR